MDVSARPLDVMAARGTSRLRSAVHRIGFVLAQESLPLLVLAACAAVVARLLPYQLLQDGWLTLVAGREIVESGLPSTDSLTVWSRGVEWVDQQWLAQLALYGMASLGGVKLALLTHFAVLVSTMALALAAARNLGASAPPTALVATLAALMAPWTLQLRAQTLALPLFVGLLWLLARDAARPSPKVWWTIPILVIWANVHGSVLVGVALVVLRAVLRRSWLLALSAIVVAFASPYALELPGYYRTMLLDSDLRTFVAEWQASTPSALTAVFYVTGLVAIWLIGRRPHVLTRFESVALVGLFVAAIPAIRSIVWFGFASMILLPRLVAAQFQSRDSQAPPAAAAVGAAALIVVTVVVAAAATRPPSWFEQQVQPQAAASAAVGTRVLADEQFADWLLWQRPELRGRVAFDARFELLDRGDYERLWDYHHRSGRGWMRVTDGFDTLVIDAAAYPEKVEELRGSFVPVFRNQAIAVLRRRAPSEPRAAQANASLRLPRAG